MNDRFFMLSKEKQQRIFNAAFKVFSESSYKKASMAEIAAVGEISKSLLFHYFVNKKELYLYLWHMAINMTKKAISDYEVLETKDFFEMLKRSLIAKCSLMREYPHIGAFSLNAYYEEDPEIKKVIQASYSDVSQTSEDKVFNIMYISGFRKDIDLKVMYSEIFYAIDGYMLKQYRSGQIVPNKIEREIDRLIDLWKVIYTEKRD